MVYRKASPAMISIVSLDGIGCARTGDGYRELGPSVFLQSAGVGSRAAHGMFQQCLPCHNAVDGGKPTLRMSRLGEPRSPKTAEWRPSPEREKRRKTNLS